MPRRGFDIALCGFDGVGKSTLSEGLATALRDRGYRLRTVSWRQYLDPAPTVDGGAALGAVYTAMLRVLYSACVGPDGESAERLLPGLDGTLDKSLLLGRPPVPLALHPDRATTFVASGLLEVAARLVERDAVIEPALARGEVVIQESHGLKNCLKLGVMAEHVAGADGVTADYVSLVRRCLTRWAPPTVSVLVTGDPHVAFVRRRRQNGYISRGEHLDENGEPVEATFVDLQVEIQRRLTAIADAEGWPRVSMADRPRDEAVASGVETVLRALAERGVLPMEPAR